MDKAWLSWLGNNWFKLAVITALAVVAYFTYYGLVQLPEKRFEENQAAEAAAALQTQQYKEESAKQLQTCLSTAQEDYTSNWNNDCYQRSLLSNSCIDLLIKSTNMLEAFFKYSTWHPSSSYQDFSLAYSSCSCRLPITIADSWNKLLQQDKDLCLKQYPQN